MYQNVMFMPHPPIILKEIGKEEINKIACTIEGMRLLSKKVAQIKPETIIFLTPHGNSFSNGTCLLDSEELIGDFEKFGHKELGFRKKVNQELTRKIFDTFEQRNFVAVLMDEKLSSSYNIDIHLDHGVMVPMYFIDKEYTDYNIVHITPGFTPLEESYFLGKLMKDVVDEWTKMDPSKVLILCSGDLSHALSDEGPYEYHKSGPAFDHIIKEAIEHKKPVDLIRLKAKFIEDAASCGLRSFLMGFGYMDGLTIESKVISYEGPFGVGYLTGYLESDSISATQSMTNNNNSVSYIPTINDIVNNRYNKRVQKEDDYIKLARKSIEYYVHTSKKYNVEAELLSAKFIERGLNEKSGVFVSIHKDGKLRGCIGTIEANAPNLIEEIIYNAISACSSDPRFHPIENDELLDLEINVDILHPSEKINGPAELDVKKYGVIVEQGYKRGLLLPNLDGISSVSDQISIAKQKAGITKGKVELYRFEVERHEII